MNLREPFEEALRSFAIFLKGFTELFFFAVQVVINAGLFSYVGLRTGNALIDRFSALIISVLFFYIGLRLGDLATALFQYVIDRAKKRYVSVLVFTLPLMISMAMGIWLAFNMPIFINGLVVSTNS